MELFFDFSFVLSGFVVRHTYRAKLNDYSDLKFFALRRLARLWPLHMAMLAILVLLNLAWLMVKHPAFQYPDTWKTLVENILLLQAFTAPNYSWDGQSIYISVAWWTYLIFGAGFVLVPRKHASACALVILLGAALKLLVFSLYFHQTFVSQWLARSLFGFFTGQCAYFLWRKKTAPTLGAATMTMAECMVVLVIVLIIGFEQADDPIFLLTAPAFGALIWIFSEERGAISRMLLHPLPRLLGRLSYSIFLTHTLVVAVLGSALRHHAPGMAENRWAGDVMLPIYLAMTVCVSWCTFRWIEKPGARIFGRRAAPHLPT